MLSYADSSPTELLAPLKDGERSSIPHHSGLIQSTDSNVSAQGIGRDLDRSLCPSDAEEVDI